MTLSQISSGTLIDQKVLSDLINKVNEIDNNQYNSVSSIPNGLSATKQNLQNGEWAVSSVYEKPTIGLFAENTRVSGPFSASFGMSFDTIPMVTGTIYSSTDGERIQNILSTIIITEITTDGFNYKIVAGPAGVATNETIGVMFTAIGKIKKVG